MARIITFGLPGTSMAGHEWLDDETVVELANYLVEMHHQDVQGRRKN